MDGDEDGTTTDGIHVGIGRVCDLDANDVGTILARYPQISVNEEPWNPEAGEGMGMVERTGLTCIIRLSN